MKTKPRYVCEECRITSPGVHWIDDGDPRHQPRPVPCPSKAAAATQQQAQQLTADAHTQAFKAAKQIIADAALTAAELNGNSVREAMEAAQVPSGVIGAAFSACARDGLIEATGRYVQSTEATTRHKIAVWASRTYSRKAS